MWWVRRSSSVPVRRSGPKTSVHSSKGRLVVTRMEPRAWRCRWNRTPRRLGRCWPGGRRPGGSADPGRRGPCPGRPPGAGGWCGCSRRFASHVEYTFCHTPGNEEMSLPGPCQKRPFMAHHEVLSWDFGISPFQLLAWIECPWIWGDFLLGVVPFIFTGCRVIHYV